MNVLDRLFGNPLDHIVSQRNLQAPVVLSFGAQELKIGSADLQNKDGETLRMIRIIHEPHAQASGYVEAVEHPPPRWNDIWLHAATPEGIEVLGRACMRLAEEMRAEAKGNGGGE